MATTHLLRMLVLLLTCGCPLHASEKLTPPRIVAIDPSLKHDVRTTTLSFVASGRVAGQVRHLASPDRIVIDFPEINFQFEPAAGTRGAGLIRSYRYGMFAKGRSRVVIDLEAPAVVNTVTVIAGKSDGAQLVTIVLTRAEPAAFAAAVAASAELAPPAELPAGDLAKDPVRRTIVIDPGHGGVDPGAVAKSGLSEKDLVFDFARRLKARLEANPSYRIVMTRDEDVFVSLGERVRIARKVEADLLISLHADALHRFDQVKGATVYTASAKATDAQAARVAEKENKADAAAGLVDDAAGKDEVTDILGDLARRETRALSQFASDKLLGAMGGSFRMNKNPRRAAGFKVLSAPDVPSLLLELGYLSSPADVEAFASETWKENAVSAVLRGIDAYFERQIAVKQRPSTP